MKPSTIYDDFAQKYSESFLKDNAKSIAQYFMHVDFDLKEKKLLDLGCGDGYDLHRFGQLGALLYGVDASQEMVALAKKTRMLKQKSRTDILKHSIWQKGQQFQANVLASLSP